MHSDLNVASNEYRYGRASKCWSTKDCPYRHQSGEVTHHEECEPEHLCGRCLAQNRAEGNHGRGRCECTCMIDHHLKSSTQLCGPPVSHSRLPLSGNFTVTAKEGPYSLLRAPTMRFRFTRELESRTDDRYHCRLSQVWALFVQPVLGRVLLSGGKASTMQGTRLH